jgi:aspartate/methionine/tyrosine aminotransferase
MTISGPRSVSTTPSWRGVSAELASVPPYPFAGLEAEAESLSRQGRSVLRFALGDPDLPPPTPMLDALRESVESPGIHAYSTSRGEPSLRGAIASWMHTRFGVTVDPEREVAVLLGTKEGLTALPRALLNRGESVAVPDPGYPAYIGAAMLSGLRVERFALDPARAWSPDWSALPWSPGLAYLNYPNNPTGQTVEPAVLREAVDAARSRGFTLAFDNAYSEITFGGAPAPSLLQIPGAREVGVEFHSFSKTFGVPGWRLGFAVGNADVIGSLVRLKSQLDSGAATPLQRAAIRGLQMYRSPERPPEIEERVAEYRRRSDRLVHGLETLGERVVRPGGTLYVWQRVEGRSGAQYADEVLQRHGILLTPGSAFGSHGTNYVRWSITRPESEIELALTRLGNGHDGGN